MYDLISPPEYINLSSKSRHPEVTSRANLRLSKQARWHAILRSEAVAGSPHVPCPRILNHGW